MPRTTQAFLLLTLLILAALLRFRGIDWDAYNHYHPDERYIAWVAASVEWPSSLQEVFDPHKSTFNPYYWPNNVTSEGIQLDQGVQRRFAYGHVPLYLSVLFTRALEKIGPAISPLLPDSWLLKQDILNSANLIEFRHLTAAGRALTAAVDLATIVVVFLLGRMLFSPGVGLLAASFLALNVMHIQLAHFLTADPYLTLFVSCALLFLVMALKVELSTARRRAFLVLAASFTGLAIGSKFSAVLLYIPLITCLALIKEMTRRKKLLAMLLALLVSLLVFALSNPYAILDWTCAVEEPFRLGPIQLAEHSWGSCYLENIFQQGSMVRGARDVPFVRQYAGTAPYLYFIEMQLRWGMGPALGLLAFAGFGWAAWRGIRYAAAIYRRIRLGEVGSRLHEWVNPNSSELSIAAGEMVVLGWMIPFFIFTGSLDVKFMRYLQPLVPFLMIYGAAMLLSWKNTIGKSVIGAMVLIITLLFSLAFVQIYSQPHPWIEASTWIYENIEREAVIVNEVWDDPLPDTILKEGEVLGRTLYDSREVNWLSGTEEHDSIAKLDENLQIIASADYLLLSSNRNYGVIPRLEERYPLSSQYYQLLFDGTLGYENVYVTSRFPELFGVYIKPDYFDWPGLTPPPAVESYLSDMAGINLGRTDESFTVYDQPLVMIFRNQEGLSADQMMALFDTTNYNDDGST